MAFPDLPWRPLAAIAGCAVLTTTLLDIALRLGARYLPLLNGVLSVMLEQNWVILTNLLMGFAIGLLAFVYMEKGITGVQLRINVASLWALILCVAIALWLRSVIPVYGIFVNGINSPTLVGILCGVFWQSRRYWRY